jgi:uncharacterized membrane protein YhfC
VLLRAWKTSGTQGNYLHVQDVYLDRTIVLHSFHDYIFMLFCSGLSSNTNNIHRNMVLAIVIAEIVYVFGINRTSNKVS